MKKICINIVTSLVFLLAANFLHAETVSLNKLNMNGIASFEKLRKEYYIGALYLEEKSNFPDYVLSMSGKKVMDIRIVADEWTSRNFNSLWTEAILINNDETAQKKLNSVIIDFGKMLKGNLKKGDRLSFVYTPNVGTSIILNGARLMETKDDGLFNLLLNSWIGMRPFSSDFKRDLLNLNTEPKTAELIKRYENIKPSAKRVTSTAPWAMKTEEEKPEAKPEPKKVVAVATPVKATPSKEPTKPAATPTPKAEPVKTPVAAAAPVAVPPPAAAPAAIPPPPPLPAAPVANTAVDLLDVYKSNIYKLTYRNTIYPPRSINLKQEGVIILKIKINRDGKVINTTEEKTSEFSSLNKAAETAIKRSAPYPAPPDALKGDSFEISIPFNFKL